MPVLSTTTQPLPAAVEQMAGRAPLGRSLTAAEWMLVPAEIRLRAMFSSRVECERLLAEFHDRMTQRITLESSRLADGSEGVTMDRGRFVREMREYLDKTGYRPPPKHAGTLRDLTSQGRLGLIWQMNIDQAQGYAEWKTGNSRVALQTFPAMEFIRLSARREIRVWPEIWAAHGGKFYGQPGPAYPNAPGRMLALKTDPIWTAINRFGVPWKPFDWGSGMGTRTVGRREALALGVLKETDPPQQARDVPYNKDAQASLKGISPARRRAIEDAFAGDVEIDGDTIRLLPPQSYDSMKSSRRRQVPELVVNGAYQAPPPLTGKSLADIMIFEPSPGREALIARLAEAVAMADAVIGGGSLRTITVRIGSPATFKVGEELDPGYYPPVSGLARMPVIWINPGAIPEVMDPAVVFWHELGHAVDNLGLQSPGPEPAMRLYASEGQPSLRKLMDLLDRSPAVSRMRDAFGARDEWLQRREIFSRAFAQYISARGGDMRARATLNSLRDGRFENAGLARDLQWTPAQFRDVRKELDRLFRAAGWKGGGL